MIATVQQPKQYPEARMSGPTIRDDHRDMRAAIEPRIKQLNNKARKAARQEVHCP